MGKGSIVNLLCRCGSGKKYKRCCKSKDEHIDREKVNIAIHQELRINNIKECLFPKKNGCSEKTIKAHSIQNNRILDYLSENGELIMLRPNATETDFKVQAAKIGRGNATVFTGFCREHDKAVFQPIEDKDYNLTDLQQNAIFAYRAFTKEHHAKLTQQQVFFKNQHINEEVRLALIGAEAALRDMDEYRDSFKKILFQDEFNLIETKNIIFNESYEFSVSSAMHMNYDFNRSVVNDLNNLKKTAVPLFITIFPTADKTHVLMSYFKKYAKKFDFLDEQLINVDSYTQQTRITNLLMIGCENIVFSPRLWNKISQDKQDLYLSKMLKNLRDEELPGDISKDYGVNFFI